MKRRDFLHNLSHATAAGFMLPAFARTMNLSDSNSYLAQTFSRGKIMVLIKLNGGNDGLNTVIPLDQLSPLNTARPHVILPENSILNLNSNDLGLHPELTAFQNLFNEDRLKIIQNVGYDVPDFSHFRSMDIWESASDYNQFVTSGWMGRYIENQHPNYPENYPNTNYPHPLSIELGSPSLLLTGKKAFTSFVARDPENFQEIINEFDNNYDTSSYAGTKLDYIQLVGKQSNIYGEILRDVYNSGQVNSTFSNADFSQQLEIVAKLISGGLNTRIYMVELGGFDTHDTQVDINDHTQGSHSVILKQLNDGIAAFMANMDAIGRSDDVLMMSYSEFGRTIVSNGSRGTDHGTAAPLFVIGNKVDPSILGDNPVIPANAEWQDNLATEFDFRQVYSSVMNQWLTINPSTEEDVLFKKFDQLQIIQPQYIDTDGDGVSDDRDQCNNTPLGSLVDLNGCAIFSLAPSNYTIQTNGVSCPGNANGRISISVDRTDLVYHLHIAELNEDYTLNGANEHSLSIADLAIGDYTLTFTVDGEDSYNQIFKIGIQEPDTLTAKTSVNKATKTISISANGSSIFYATVNGVRQEFRQPHFSLSLHPGLNRIQISTPQPCQGSHYQEVFISEAVQFYPNPVDTELNLIIPGSDAAVHIGIYNRAGILMEKMTHTIPASRIVQLDTRNLRSDIYIVKLNGVTVETAIKVQKK